MDKPDHILIVDDDAQLVELLRDYLTGEGYRVSSACHADEMRAVLSQGAVQIIVLDLMLPGENGLAICRDLRTHLAPHVPVLMLSARGDETDRVVGLEVGADDYLTKPMARRELLARVRALLRRSRMPAGETAATLSGQALVFGEWRLDTGSHHLIDGKGITVPLTSGEFRLLKVLLSYPNRVLNREQLLSLTQGREADVFDRSIDLLMSRLRRRLREDPRAPRYIKTLRNEGYMFCEAVQHVTPT